MPAKLTLSPTIHSYPVLTVNLGTAQNKFGPSELGKAVKMTGADTYGLCAEDDPIEGIVQSVNEGTRGGFSVGGIGKQGYVEVVAATTLAFGDYVVAGAQPALGTYLSGIGSNDTPATPVKKLADPATAGRFALRIVGLGRVGTGAAGTICIAEFV